MKWRKRTLTFRNANLASWDEEHKMFSAHTATTDDFRVATHDNAKEERNRPEGTKLTWVLVTLQDPSLSPSPSHRGPNAPLNAASGNLLHFYGAAALSLLRGKRKTRNKTICRVEKSETGSGAKRHRFKCPWQLLSHRAYAKFVLSPDCELFGSVCKVVLAEIIC